MNDREMNCPLAGEESADILLDYTAGRLDRERAVRLERHMQTCRACATFGVEQAALWSTLDEWEPAPVSMDFNRRLWQHIDLSAMRPWHQRFAEAVRFGTWKPAIPLAAAAIVIAAGFIMDHQKIGLSSPGASGNNGVPVMEIDQVEKTLDDIQLLKQFDSTVTEAGGSRTM